MNIYTECSSCQEEIKMHTFARTRVELAMSKGEEIELSCPSCNKIQKYPVDKFEARVSTFLFIVAGIGLAMAYAALLYVFIYIFSAGVLVASSIIIIPASAYGIISKQEYNRVDSFNVHKLKRFR